MKHDAALAAIDAGGNQFTGNCSNWQRRGYWPARSRP
jgi:hypothetical protein